MNTKEAIYNEVDIILSTRKLLTEYVNYMSSQPIQVKCRELYRDKVKNLSVEILEEQKTFFVPPDGTDYGIRIPEKYLDLSIGTIGKYGRLSYSGRFVYPVQNAVGDVIGLVAHDPTTDNKYLDIKSLGYNPKRTTCFGMEKTYEYLSSDKPTFFLEGIGCTLYLRSKGYQAYALLGSNITPYVMKFIKRHKNPVICPDSDSAGNKLRTQARLNNVNIYTIPYELGKDIDDARKKDEELILNGLNNFYY